MATERRMALVLAGAIAGGVVGAPVILAAKDWVVNNVVVRNTQIDGRNEVNCAGDLLDSYFVRQSLPTGEVVSLSGGATLNGRLVPEVEVRSGEDRGVTVKASDKSKLERDLVLREKGFTFMDEGVTYDVSVQTSVGGSPILDINLSC